MDTNGESNGVSVFTILRALNRRKWYLIAPVLLVTGAVSVYCLASTTFPGQRQLFFPIGDNYPLGLNPVLVYAGAGRSRG